MTLNNEAPQSETVPLKWRRNVKRQKVIVEPNPRFTSEDDPNPRKNKPERERLLMTKNALQAEIKKCEAKIKRLKLEYELHKATGEGGEYEVTDELSIF